MLIASVSFAADDPLETLKGQTLQFFTPVSGKIIRVEGNTVTFESDAKEKLRPGMRLNILREGEPFRHPMLTDEAAAAPSSLRPSQAPERVLI